MSLSELPLPSIAHVLASNRVYFTRPPSIDCDRDHFPATSQMYMMTTNDQRDYESLEYQFLSYILRAQPMHGVQASMKGEPERPRKAICLSSSLSNAIHRLLHLHPHGSFFRKLRH